MPGLLTAVASLSAQHRFWGTWASVAAVPGARAQAPWLWCMGSVAPWLMGSSQIRDQTHVSCTGRRILYHGATREACVPHFGVVFWFTPYGKGEKELCRKLFSWFASLPFFLSSPPPAHSKTTNSFWVSPEQFHDLLWQPDSYCLNMASAHPSFSRDYWFLQWRKKWQPTPVFLPGEFFGWKGLVGCSPWGRRESDMTEPLTHTDSYKGMLKSVKWYIFPLLCYLFS